MWHAVLQGLVRRARLEFVPDGRSPARRPDVWLVDGHRAAPVHTSDQPLVAMVHEMGWIEPEQAATLAPEFIAETDRVTRATLSLATRVLVPSTYSQRQVTAATGIGLSRIHVAPHGVDHRRFNPRARRTGSPMAWVAPYVLFVGVAHPRKNVDVLRGAISSLANDGLPHRLVLVAQAPGDRPDGQVLLEQATAPLFGDPGRVHSMLAVDERSLARLMAGAVTLCLPSLGDGFGLPVLEAMACGTPVVVSDRGALPEVVGDAGLIVAPCVEQVAQAITRLHADPSLAGSLAEAGRIRARQFTWGRTVAAWHGALVAAVERGRDR